MKLETILAMSMPGCCGWNFGEIGSRGYSNKASASSEMTDHFDLSVYQCRKVLGDDAQSHRTLYLQNSPPEARQESSVITTLFAPHIARACLYQPMTVMQSAVEKVSAS